LAVRKIVSMVR